MFLFRGNQTLSHSVTEIKALFLIYDSLFVPPVLINGIAIFFLSFVEIRSLHL